MLDLLAFVMGGLDKLRKAVSSQTREPVLLNIPGKKAISLRFVGFFHVFSIKSGPLDYLKG